MVIAIDRGGPGVKFDDLGAVRLPVILAKLFFLSQNGPALIEGDAAIVVSEVPEDVFFFKGLENLVVLDAVGLFARKPSIERDNMLCAIQEKRAEGLIIGVYPQRHIGIERFDLLRAHAELNSVARDRIGDSVGKGFFGRDFLVLFGGNRTRPKARITLRAMSISNSKSPGT